ncbi:hypothetical protein OPQ81_000409 [Rhizoctonia solani]|nr:hypothetical protein OPQ81_000409 [Rhizoctonia solani]
MSKSTELLKVKKVIVIGGSSGHGRLLDAATLAHSASVVISSSSQEKVDIAIDRLKQGVSPISNVTLIGQAVGLKYFKLLKNFFTKEGPFNYFLRRAVRSKNTRVYFTLGDNYRRHTNQL